MQDHKDCKLECHSLSGFELHFLFIFYTIDYLACKADSCGNCGVEAGIVIPALNFQASSLIVTKLSRDLSNKAHCLSISFSVFAHSNEFLQRGQLFQNLT